MPHPASPYLKVPGAVMALHAALFSVVTLMIAMMAIGLVVLLFLASGTDALGAAVFFGATTGSMAAATGVVAAFLAGAAAITLRAARPGTPVRRIRRAAVLGGLTSVIFGGFAFVTLNPLALAWIAVMLNSLIAVGHCNKA